MSTRSRATVTLLVALVMLLSSVPFAGAAPASEAARDLRAELLAARAKGTVAQSGLISASTMDAMPSTEVTIPVLGEAWYKDSAGLQHYDGFFGAEGNFQDVWVMIEFMNSLGNPVGMEEVMANEYVVEGEGSWSAVFPKVPTGTTHAHATVYGTPTEEMAFMPSDQQILGTMTLPGTDRMFNGMTMFGMEPMEGMPTDPTLAGLVVSGVEFHMGAFHDVAVGGEEAAKPGPILPGTQKMWTAWGARPADMATDIRWFRYSAAEYSTISASASTLMPAYGASVRLSGKSLDSTGNPVAGMPVAAITATGYVAGTAVTAADGSYAISVKPAYKSVYTVVSLGDSFIASAESKPVVVDPKVYLSTPSGPTSTYVNRAFTSYGYLKPRVTAGTYPVVIKAYRKYSTGWVLKKTVKAKASNYSTYSKYTASVSLPLRGSWKIVAYHDDALHAPTTSGTRYITVR